MLTGTDPAGEATVAVSLLSTTMAFALSRGISVEDMEAEAGVSAFELMNPQARVSDEVVPRMWNALSMRFPEEALSVELGRAAPLTSLAGLAHGAQFAQNLRAALALLIDHRQLLADRLSLELRETDEETAFILSHPLDGVDGGRAHESGSVLVKRLVNEVLEIEGFLLAVEFASTGHGPVEAYDAFFGVPVRFQQSRNALILKPESLSWATSQANLQLFAFVRQYFGQALRQLRSALPSEIAGLREAIVKNAAGGDFSAAAAAARAHLSLRAAQRLAAQHGTSLSALIDTVREGTARELLLDASISIEKIAALVGYADDRAFRRAFKRWTGLSPSEFRQQT